MYIKKLFTQTAHFVNRVRWKVYHKDKDDKVPNCANYKTYGFKSSRKAPPNNELKLFEKDLYDMVRNIQFRPVKNDFQKELKEDIRKIKNTENLIVQADKTTNLYEVSKDTYDKLMVEHISKDYKKVSPNAAAEINKEALQITSKLNLEDRVKSFMPKEAFISLKDHKPEFEIETQCRLLNPAKSEVGRISKLILQEINEKIKQLTEVNQWKNTSSVISWFKRIANKEKMRFLKFDIVNFYPSISEKLFNESIEFANSLVTIGKEDIDIIRHARKSLLFYKDSVWCKRNDKNLFDVPQGSFDSAELCDLVGLFMLSKMSNFVKKKDIGLYRDDGLAVMSMSGRELESTRKKLHELFKMHGLKITAVAGLIKTDFLDVTFDLSGGKYYPYRKPNDSPLYINVHSNHPRAIVKEIPNMINKRLSDLSCSSEEFDKSKIVYGEALKKSGYNKVLEYEDVDRPRSKNRRKRKILWYNPPYSMNVKTNVGKKLLNLVSKHFPRGHKFYPLFNKLNVKVSYCCMDNMASVIQKHNKKILSSSDDLNQLPCNCRVKNSCPLNGECRAKSIVYKATVKSEVGEKVYYGRCETEFKFRYYNHISSFNHDVRPNSTALCKHVHRLEQEKIDYSIDWRIARKATPFRNGGKQCDLCLTEKYCIAMADQKTLLNKRNEFISQCPHIKKFYLINSK